MPPQLLEDLKKRIVKWYYKNGLMYREIRNLEGVSLGLISNNIQNYHDFDGQVKNPFQHITGQLSYLNEDNITFIESILKANPLIYLDELPKKLSDT